MPVALCTTMIRLNQPQRRALNETLRGLANFTAVAFVLGQFVGQRVPSIWLALVGTITWFALVSWALWLEGVRADGSNG